MLAYGEQSPPELEFTLATVPGITLGTLAGAKASEN